MKQYIEEKHFDLSNALAKNQAYFEDIDFSNTPMEQIKNKCNLLKNKKNFTFLKLPQTCLTLLYSPSNPNTL